MPANPNNAVIAASEAIFAASVPVENNEATCEFAYDLSTTASRLTCSPPSTRPNTTVRARYNRRLRVFQGTE